jgi:hypothetical protein
MAAISSDNFGRPMGCGHGGEVSCLEGTRLLKPIRARILSRVQVLRASFLGVLNLVGDRR